MLLRYGAQYQNAENTLSASLFSMDDDVAMLQASRPKIPSVPAWDALARLNQEKELVGMYLSAHPLDPYKLEVEYGVDYTIADKNQISEETARTFTFAGMIVDVSERTSRKGSPLKVVQLEDYTGSTDFILFDRQITQYAHLLNTGTAIVVRAQMRRDKKTGDLRLGIEDIRSLTDLKDKLFSALVLTITPEDLPAIEELLNKYAGTGDKPRIPVEFFIEDQELNRSLHFQSALQIVPCIELVEALRQASVEYRLERSNISNN